MSRIRSIYNNFSFRNRRILLSGISSLGAKGINMLVLLLSVPLAYNYLGEERYGMMMTILSVVSMLGFADLGLGFGLQNNIPQYIKSEEKSELQKAISSTFFILTTVAACLLLLFLSIVGFISWDGFLNVKGLLAISEAKPSIIVFSICFLISLPLSLVQKVQNGFQEAYYNELWKACGNIFGLLALIFFIQTDRGVPWLILAIYGTNTLFLLFNFSYKFFIRRKILIPRLRFFDRLVFKELFRDGSKFFVILLLSILTLALDSLIIANYFGAEAVASYNIGYRIVMLFTIPAVAFINPMLFAYNDAIANQDLDWIQKNSRRTLSMSLAMSVVFSLLMLVGTNFFISIWIGPKAMVSYSLVVAFAAYIFFYNFNSFFSTIMLSSKFLNSCLVFYSIAALISFGLKFILLNYWGIPGILWATVIGITIFFIFPSFYIMKTNKYI